MIDKEQFLKAPESDRAKLVIEQLCILQPQKSRYNIEIYSSNRLWKIILLQICTEGCCWAGHSVHSKHNYSRLQFSVRSQIFLICLLYVYLQEKTDPFIQSVFDYYITSIRLTDIDRIYKQQIVLPYEEEEI